MLSRLKHIGMLARTASALGPVNIGRVLHYRRQLKSIRPPAELHLPQGPYFRPVPAGRETASIPAVSHWQEGGLLFGRHPVAFPDGIPDFLSNPFSGAPFPTANELWWTIPDFTAEAGDIKEIWDISRFSWAPAFAQYARKGDPLAIDRLNRWIARWSAQNPPGRGPNWKCGQEASIRIMHLVTAMLVLDQQDDPLEGLTELVARHAARIHPTIGYAIGQDNNHGTSEAAALLLAGSWPGRRDDPLAKRWHDTGRKWLENRVARLIGADGTFSLYSTNYHRSVLDTLSLVEIWRRKEDLPSFSDTFYHQAGLATDWLRALTDPVTGDVPNTGQNDGSRLIPLSDTPFRDYRPSVQLASQLFLNRVAYGEGRWNDQLRWLGLCPTEERLAPLGDRIADDGGFGVLRRGNAAALLRIPRFRFRPSQADALHLDLTIAGENWLRDGGSFSYAIAPELLDYFSGVRSHNTIQFDDRDQMPRLSRFLYGAWLKGDIDIRPPQMPKVEKSLLTARYRDWMGASHTRSIALAENTLEVIDDVDGFTQSAVLRWRLAPRSWRLTADGAMCDEMRITIGSDAPITRLEIVEGLESRHYLEKTPIPVLEVEIRKPGGITSFFQW